MVDRYKLVNNNRPFMPKCRHTAKKPDIEIKPETTTLWIVGNSLDDGDEKYLANVTTLMSLPNGSSVDIYMDCHGGHTTCALTIAYLIESKNLKARMIMTGDSASAAAHVFAACKERYVATYACLYMHNSNENQPFFWKVMDWIHKYFPRFRKRIPKHFVDREAWERMDAQIQNVTQHRKYMDAYCDRQFAAGVNAPIEVIQAIMTNEGWLPASLLINMGWAKLWRPNQPFDDSYTDTESA